jgi:hypothetical protein
VTIVSTSRKRPMIEGGAVLSACLNGALARQPKMTMHTDAQTITRNKGRA